VSARRGQRGQSLVETALVLPILLIILLGIFDFGRAVFAYNAISNAAREAARVAIVNQNATGVVDEGKRAAIGLNPDTVDVTFAITGTGCGTVLVGCTAQVTVDHEWSAITPIIGSIIGPIQLSSTTEMRVERAFSAP
jgi:Flp pilus assembly protein TadG